MRYIIFLTFFLLSLNLSFSQQVDRNPQKSVKAQNKSEIIKEKESKEGALVFDEGIRRTEVYPDGSKIISLKFTEVAPNQFHKEDMLAQKTPLSELNWTKEDLGIYIKSLESKRSAVSKRPDAHALALQNGWYEFMDSVILEARALMNNL